MSRQTEKQAVDEWDWVGLDLPHRKDPEKGTYGIYSWADLPVLQEIPEFWTKVRTINEVILYEKPIEARIRSPTACFVTRGSDDSTFWMDQQGCVVWKWERETGRVYHPSFARDGTRVYVAHSIGEFFARLEIENAIWYCGCFKMALGPREEAYVEHYRLLPHLETLNSWIGEHMDVLDVANICCDYLVQPHRRRTP